MIVTLSITLASVVIGAGLAVVTARGNLLLGGLRTFAIAAVAATVLVQILPEAVADLGGAALLAFAAALVLPGLVSQGLRRLRRNIAVETIGADFGYIGFAAHQFAEGIALGTLTGGEHAGHGHGDLVMAMAAHTVPLTAVFVAAWLTSRGKGSAARRTVGLLVATALGFALAGTVQRTEIALVQPWLSSFVAGFLCHVLLHDHGTTPRRGPLASALDVVGATAGVFLPVLALGAHRHGSAEAADQVRHLVGEAFVELVAETAPMLLLGLVLGAILQVVGSRIPGQYFARGSASRQALRGIAVGAPLPLCACGVLPIAEALRRRGAGPAMVMAFLVATPELGPETLTLTIRLLGGPFALVRLFAALALAYIAALAFAWLARWPSRSAPPPAPEASERVGVDAKREPLRWTPVFRYFDELVLHTAPWTFVGLVAAAYVQAVLPAESLASLAERGLDVIVVGLVAMPTYVCAASATPIAAVLLLKGISPGAVLVGLLLGPATNIATIGVLRRGYGRRAVYSAIGFIVAVSFSFGYLVNALGVDTEVPAEILAQHDHAWWAWACVGVMGLVLVGQLWRWGTRPWSQILDVGHDHGHDHDHDHDHDHGHDHHHHHHH